MADDETNEKFQIFILCSCQRAKWNSLRSLPLSPSAPSLGSRQHCKCIRFMRMYGGVVTRDSVIYCIESPGDLINI